jgi:hypothetical protein
LYKERHCSCEKFLEYYGEHLCRERFSRRLEWHRGIGKLYLSLIVGCRPNGSLYVADGHNNVIRKINLSTGTVSTYAGTGTAGFGNGAIGAATFNDPYGMAIDAAGNLYVADIKNNCIRKITIASGTVSTFAGSGTQGLTNGSAASATFYYPLGCAFDSGGNMYVADTYNNVIRKISAAGTVTTFAGTGAQGSTDGPASSATFNFPIGVAISGNGVYIADTHNNTIRKITVN